MTQNLRIGGSTIITLRSDSSDVVNNYNFPVSTNSGGFMDVGPSNLTYPELYVEDNHYGGFYNWIAATVGEGLGHQADINWNAQHSICPKGWKLPYADEASKFIENYTYSEIFLPPLNYTLSGYYENKQLTGRNTLGRYVLGSGSVIGSYREYWSAIIFNNIDAFGLTRGGGEPRIYFGYNIRCIAREMI